MAAIVAGSGGVAVATAGPVDQPRVDVSSVNAWLPSVQRQFIGRTSALVRQPSAATGAVVPVRMSSGVTVLRRPGRLVVFDGAGGDAWLIDPRTRARQSIPAAVDTRLDVLDGRPVRIEPTARQVTALDGTGVGTRWTAQLPGEPGGHSEVSGRALWLTIPGSGAIVRISASGDAKPVAGLFAKGQDPLVTAVEGGVALLDEARGEVHVLTGAGPAHRVYGIGADVAAGPYTALFVSADNGYAVLVRAGRDASYRVAGLAADHPGAAGPLGEAGHDFGAPVLLDDRLYAADETTGGLVIVPVGPNGGSPSTIGVARGPARLEVFAEEGVVWVNDPNGPDALAVHNGDRWPVVKYLPQSPAKTRPAPSKPPPKVTKTPPLPPKVSDRPSTEAPTVRPPRTPGRTAPSRSTKPNGPPTPSPSASPSPTNTARITNIQENDSVSTCERVTGRADVEASKALFLVHRRVSPSSDTYYFYYVSGSRDGGVGRTWSSEMRFGTAAGQSYELLLLIIDVDDARDFWNSHQVDDFYAAANSLPAGSKQAHRLGVRQTDATDC
ncbi:hypothetical protein [Phytohabitans houttuyneae]|nr:hypothetical protein [Phytohabitans houttuyneae]